MTQMNAPSDINDIRSAVKNLINTVGELDARLTKGIDDLGGKVEGLETEFKDFARDVTAILANVVDHQIEVKGRLASIDQRLGNLDLPDADTLNRFASAVEQRDLFDPS